MAVRIQIRRGTAAQWAAANTLLAPGEQGYETDTGRLKVGDGATAWAGLDYYDEHVAANVIADPAVVDALASSPTVVDAAAAAVDASPTIATHTAAIARVDPGVNGEDYQRIVILDGAPAFVDRDALSVRWFYNAATDDGDWALAFNRMFSALSSSVGMMARIPAGTYPIKTTINIQNAQGITVTGDGQESSRIVWQGATGGIMVNIRGVRNSRFGGFSIQGDYATTTAATIDGEPGGIVATENLFYQVAIIGHRFGVRFGGVTHFQADQTKFDRCRFSGCREVAVSLEDANSVAINFHDTEFIYNGKSISSLHFYGAGGTGGAFNATGCSFISNRNWDFEVFSSSRGCSLTGNIHEGIARLLRTSTGATSVTATLQECSVNGIAYSEQFTPPASGTYTLTYKGQTTPAMAWDSTPDQITGALVALSTVGSPRMDVVSQGPGQPLVIVRDHPLTSDTTPLTTSAGTITPVDYAVEWRASGALTFIGGKYSSQMASKPMRVSLANPNNRRANITAIGTVFDGDPFKGSVGIFSASVHLANVQFQSLPSSPEAGVGNVSGPLATDSLATPGGLGGNKVWASAAWLSIPTGTALTSGVNTFVGGLSRHCVGKTNVRIDLSHRMGGITAPINITGQDNHASVANQFLIHVTAPSAVTLTSPLVFRVSFEPEYSAYT